jgi:2,3-bisphosphoglycerate-independent phosphoglycerate mutase
MARPRKVLFLFLDGVGLGEDDPDTNPFASTPMPHLEALLGGHRLVADGYRGKAREPLVDNERASLLALDACLGVEGIPQSATGQAALLTGKNVPAWLGEHDGPKPSPPITELIGYGTVFSQLTKNARAASLVNAFPPRYFESIARGYRLPGVIALSAQQAGIPLRTKDDLFAGRAISADFSGESWRTHLGYPDVPLLTMAEAGERLNELAGQTDLTVFEYWLTDVAGHHQDTDAARHILKALDAVLGRLATSGEGDQRLVLVTSDHGNLEDMRTRHHTRNDVPLLLIGPRKLRDDFLDGVNGTCRSKPDLTDIGPAMVKFIG